MCRGGVRGVAGGVLGPCVAMLFGPSWALGAESRTRISTKGRRLLMIVSSWGSWAPRVAPPTYLLHVDVVTSRANCHGSYDTLY